MKRRLLVISTLTAFFWTGVLCADTWVDEDGDAFLTIEDAVVTIYSTGSFFYFDELFKDARLGAHLRVCLGKYSGSGIASDCIGTFNPSPHFNNGGKTRSLNFDLYQFPFLLNAFEDNLKRGEKMKISIDNFDLFSAYNLHKNNKLTKKALEILKLPD